MKLESLMASIPLITLLIFASVEFTASFTTAQNADVQTAPCVTCKKTELMEVRYAPTGELLEKSVYIRFEIYNNGSSPVSLNVTDRIACINSSTLSTLYGTQKPTNSNFGNLTRVNWENVTVEAGKSVIYQYTAESLRAVPITVNTTLLVNNEPANITKSRDTYFTKANLSDIATFKLAVTNAQQPLYTADNRTAVQPLLCTTSIPLSNDYFSGMKTSPRTNSTSTLAGKTVMTWITFLGNESQTFDISANVVGTGSWGEVPIDPIIIQVSSSSETLRTYFEGMANSLDFSIGLMGSFTKSSGELSMQTSEMYQAVDEIANATGEFGENTTSLVETLCLISNSLKMTDSMLEMAQNYIILANSSLVAFWSDNRTQNFLGNPTNSNLTKYLTYAMANMTMAYKTIDMVRYGNETVPGLGKLSNMTYEIAQTINVTGAVLGNVTDQLYELADGLYLISITANQTKMGLEQSLNGLISEKTQLEDTLLTFNSKALVPFDLEIRCGEADVSCTFQPVIPERVNGTTWMVTNITVSNPANYTRVIYGLSVRLKHGDEPFKPFVEVYVDGEWQSPSNMAQLGLTYNSTTETLYIWPWTRIDANSTVNTLVDWAGRPLRLLVNCEDEPEIECKTDVADRQKNVEISLTEGQLSYSVVQPQLIVQNFTMPTLPPPSSPPPKSLAETIMEYLQKPEIQLSTVIIVAVLVLVFDVLRKRRTERAEEKQGVSVGRTETEALLKEIEETRRILQEEEDSSD